MSYDLMTDEEILKDLAGKLDMLRRIKHIKDTELVSRGGSNRTVLKNFRGGKSGISMTSFIRLMRGLGELERLETLLELPESYSPGTKGRDIPPKRVRSAPQKSSSFKWGDEE